MLNYSLDFADLFSETDKLLALEIALSGLHSHYLSQLHVFPPLSHLLLMHHCSPRLHHPPTITISLIKPFATSTMP